MSSTTEIIIVLAVVGAGAYFLYKQSAAAAPTPAAQVQQGTSTLATGAGQLVTGLWSEIASYLP